MALSVGKTRLNRRWYQELILMVRKNPDASPKDPGQQYQEILKAQSKQGRAAIRSIQRSKLDDQKELQELGREALEELRRQEQQGD